VKSRLLRMFEESIIVQSLITLILISAISYLFVTERSVPDALLQLTLIVVGYWFGAKQSFAGARTHGQKKE
jgi:hypothetical protein